MRDLVVRESLKNLAEEASERFRELLRSGEEVPYEVLEPGNASPLATYAPQTERFIRERTALVARLDAFAAAKASIATARLATPYLERLGVVAAPSEGRRAEDAIVAFLCRVWDGRSDFAYEASRVDEAISELEACAEATEGEVEVVVPVVGLRMPTTRLELAGATIVRADVVEAPPEAGVPEGGGRADWEPQFLVHVRCDVSDIEAEAAEGEEPPATPLAERFRTVVTALRLFKSGGVGLGPHAWTRVHGGRWRRISTGAGRPRPGAYRLADTELGDLAGLSRALGRQKSRPATLERAISRFEAGLGRSAVLEALNDHLLALRFLLEGDGPARTEMSWRVAALCAEPDGRDAVRATIERAQGLERELWSGDPAPSDPYSRVDIAGDVEDLTRAILRDAACGHLGSDLRATADEILLADGLAAGEGDASQRGETSEWGIGEQPEIQARPEIQLEDRVDEPQTIEIDAVDPAIEAELEEAQAAEPRSAGEAAPKRPRDGWVPFVVEDPEVLERDAGDEEPSRAEAEAADDAPGVDREPASKRHVQLAWSREESEPEREKEPPMEPARASSHDPMPTFSFPRREPGPAMRLLDHRPEERRAMRERVSNLFPEPETTDWSVGELRKNTRRRANA
jgi:hypothetical protein